MILYLYHSLLQFKGSHFVKLYITLLTLLVFCRWCLLQIPECLRRLSVACVCLSLTSAQVLTPATPSVHWSISRTPNPNPQMKYPVSTLQPNKMLKIFKYTHLFNTFLINVQNTKVWHANHRDRMQLFSFRCLKNCGRCLRNNISPTDRPTFSCFTQLFYLDFGSPLPTPHRDVQPVCRKLTKGACLAD